ncbi:Rieske (2Fe-2S) protein [Streptomyces sp. AV19]|uniref:aromatic ring-hydroxylating oxygenase subunit alpha n=1 Tax=Streptomyces sp. AV19 TaxID=2793068 RepID=UPI0018FE3A2F|nr:Rieske 2Fe-2S domain-containing protein [Streptomyces sp. AV19]MBH1937720.1 Rieske (2Fe-2S) protein [Streptomyces sp. AV19]MDG4536388.1 Rieske (2Fe-2S) protein [Streptomyces sp. AV19]
MPGRRSYIKPQHSSVSPAYAPGHAPLPAPDGWYCLGLAPEVPPGGVLTRRLAGEDVVLWRTTDGELNATRPYCPHLGAHLGRGGRVEGRSLVCPFHGFRYDGRGACTGIAYGTDLITAKLDVLPVTEAGGLILVWHHHAGRGPSWSVPAPDTAGWSPPVQSWTEFCGHPQEILENIVDTGHFTTLHRRIVTGGHVSGVGSDGETWLTDIHVSIRLPGIRSSSNQVYSMSLHGLGYALGHIALPGGFTLRVWVLGTPVDPWRVQLRLVCSVKGRPGRPLSRMQAALVSRVALYLNAKRFVLPEDGGDAPVWNTKRYMSVPSLSESDGPVVRYRAWCRQFYPEGTAV